MTLPDVPTRGHAAVVFPAGTRFARAWLLPAADPSGAAAEPLAIGPPMYLGVGGNLLPNPDFQVVRTGGGALAMPGWSGLVISETDAGTGGPVAARGYATVTNLAIPSLPGAPIKSERIPLPAILAERSSPAGSPGSRPWKSPCR